MGRIESMQARVEEFLAKPPPRVVPPDFMKLAGNPLASFLIFLGALMGGVMALLFLTVGMFGGSRGMSPAVGFAIASGVFVCIFTSCLTMVATGILSRRRTRAALVRGRVYKGKIVKVSLLPARLNARTFSRVEVRFAGPDGSEIAGKDVVDNFIVEHFIHARDSEQEIEVLYCPNTMNRVILPMKMALGTKFD